MLQEACQLTVRTMSAVVSERPSVVVLGAITVYRHLERTFAFGNATMAFAFTIAVAATIVSTTTSFTISSRLSIWFTLALTVWRPARVPGPRSSRPSCGLRHRASARPAYTPHGDGLEREP